MPAVSIIIINYNTYRLTTNCIKSIIDRTRGVSYEIILVDNDSTECNASIFKEQYPTINLIKSNKNLGFAGGNNLGLKEAKGAYILLLNSDTELINDAISEAYKVISLDKSIGVITGQLQYPYGEIQTQAGKFPSLSREFKELLRLNKFIPLNKRPLYYLGAQWNYDNPIDADWVWGAFFMFEKSDLRFFPDQKLHDTFFMYGEDIQWCYHFKKNLKKRIVYHPAPKITHHIGGSDLNKTTSEEKHIKRMLPNEYMWLKMVKGRIYTRIYYMVLSIHYYTLRNKQSFYKGNIYLKLALKGKL